MNRSSAKSEIFGEVEIFRKIYEIDFSGNIYGSDSKLLGESKIAYQIVGEY